MNKSTILVGATCLVVGALAGYLLTGMTPEQNTETGSTEVEKKPLFYRNPMNPAITSPVPAQDSMGMDYIPVYEDDSDTPVAGTVKIDPVIQTNIGVRTVNAELKELSRTVRAAGKIDYDEEKLLQLHPKVEGWIRELRVDTTGQAVEDDDILLTFYSPKLVATQREYLLALENYAGLKDSPYEDLREGARRLVESSRERLVLLDVPEHQIVELEQSGEIKEGLHIHSPGKGTVLKVGVREGQFVNPGTELYRIANLDTVWVYADVYEYELPWISVGDEVEMTVRSVPGQMFAGEIAYIFPYAQSMTRTTRVRIVFQNPDGVLRPEMFADLSILADKRTEQVVIPAEAVVRSGDYEQIFVVNDEGSFEPRRVQLGLESKGEVAILDGVKAGERVVTSAQFLIDSESKLREATAKMTKPGHSPEAHDHRGMEHDGMDHEDMNHGGMSHEGMNHGDMKHEEMNHD